MVKINLIGKKRREIKNKNWIFVSVIVVYCGFLAYFLGSVIFVVYKLTAVNANLAAVDLETRSVSAQILKNNELLNKFVLSKFILGKIESINKSKFRYKDYLDQISGLIPPSALLNNVDFSIPGWVAVSVSTESLKPLGVLEKSISDATVLEKTLFSSVYTESVSKDKAGKYSIRLQFETRKNGRK